MSIQAQCPTCEKSYVLPDGQYGKRVRCKHCADVFVVGGAGATPAGAALPSLPVPPPVPAKKKPTDQPSMMMPLLLIGGGIVLCLAVCGGVVLWIFSGGVPGLMPVSSTETALAALKDNNGDRHREALEWLSKNKAEENRRDEVARTIDPFLSDPDQGTRQRAANALAVWGTKDNVPSLIKHVQQNQGAMYESIRALGYLRDERALPVLLPHLGEWGDGGRLTYEALQHFGPAAQKEVLKRMHDPNLDARGTARKLLAEYKTKDELLVAQSTADLASPERDSRWSAAEWLAKHPAVSAQQPGVSKALLPLINDPDGNVQGWALAALGVWGDRNDPKVAAQLVALLGTDHGRWDAAFKALQNYGNGAEKAVVTRLHDPNRDVRGNVAKLLQVYKTRDDLLLAQTLKDLGAGEKDTRWSAADWLARHKPEDAQRAAVCKALEPLLRDIDDKVREVTIQALIAWADRSAVPALTSILGEDRRHLDRILEALIRLKDERGAAAIAERLPAANGLERGKLSRALQQMGATAEKPVLELLKHADKNVRSEACKVLGVIGTRAKSEGPLTTLSQDEKDNGVKRAAADALAKVKAR